LPLSICWRRASAKITGGGSHASLSAAFTRFAEHECRGVSALYEALAEAIADDPELRALAGVARAGQPVPNLLFAAVHLLLAREPAKGDPLARYYPSLAEPAAPPTDAFPAFRQFCLAYAHAIVEIISKRSVNTNEVGRCAVLRLGYAEIARMLPAARFALAEIGASAGLNLFWDSYRYEYDRASAHDRVTAGDLTSPVRIRCAIRGTAPPLHPNDPFAERVGRRVGIDLDPIVLDNPDDVAWLRALVWSEQRERALRLDHAIAIARAARHGLNFSMRQGDGVALLPTIAAELADGEALCVVHSFTLNQFSSEARLSLDRALRDIAAQRAVLRLGLEWERRNAPMLSLIQYGGSGIGRRDLARCDAHGAWVEWLAG
jgi:hypothetical protein